LAILLAGATSHATSRPLTRLPPFRDVLPATKSEWTQTRDAFADFLGPILDDYPGVNLASVDQNDRLLSATLVYAALPGLGLTHASNLKPIQGDLVVHLDGDEHKVTLSDRAPPPRRLSKPPHSDAPITPPRHVKQAAVLMRRGNRSAAQRLLTSHGQADRNAEGAKRVADLFPDYVFFFFLRTYTPGNFRRFFTTSFFSNIGQYNPFI
jgi:hypothetical protein